MNVALRYREKHEALLKQFAHVQNTNDLYEMLILLGKALPTPLYHIEEERFLVSGCQSTMYLASHCQEGIMSYSISTDALLSRGLAALLYNTYHQESYELILNHPPQFMQELHLDRYLSPGRSNGFASLYTRMKQDAFVFSMMQTL